MIKPFTSESVTEGHPDKLCDLFSDAILDEILRQDPSARVAIDTYIISDIALVGGQVTTSAEYDAAEIVRSILSFVGYNEHNYMDLEQLNVIKKISEQSKDISLGVTEGTGIDKHLGAGDQGMMFGYACNQTDEMMPLPIVLAHELSKRLTTVRKDGVLDYLRPDGKSQVTVEYENGKVIRVSDVIVSSQHDDGVEHSRIQKDIYEQVIRPVCVDYFDSNTKIHVNPTGRFVEGGPIADAGLTGRKIIVDTYGGYAPHGGGCFSGKDPTKVDRSGAYMARFIAKNIVANGLANECEIEVAYAIGEPEPTSVGFTKLVNNIVSEGSLGEIVRDNFDLTPAGIIESLDLRKPIYFPTASYGAFGRNDLDLPWERIIDLT
jgi:S-adenosylmethionine synthetase